MSTTSLLPKSEFWIHWTGSWNQNFFTKFLSSSYNLRELTNIFVHYLHPSLKHNSKPTTRNFQDQVPVCSVDNIWMYPHIMTVTDTGNKFLNSVICANSICTKRFDPVDIAIDSKCRILVVNWHNHNIHILNTFCV